MKHLILGTAGHVDHGKTALVRALTGIECDTHREEKTRGITINLGFAHLDLPPDISYGIVDVPGHRDFVHTMVAGASGIDVALLVVAADSGIMPQTREHLQIMGVLGIRVGLVALTKSDLVDEETAEIAEEELRDLLRGTFLAEAPIIRVSSVTGDGLEELKESLRHIGARLSDEESSDIFRIFPDRLFTASGFGSIVTGSVLGGKIATGQTVYLLPGELKLRVRRLERHGAEVDYIEAGDRASMNLVGMKKEDFQRGMAISDRPLRQADMLDAHLTLFDGARPFSVWNHAVFHLGTFEEQARIHVMDADSVDPGGSAFVQIHLKTPCIVQPGDRFVLRSTSSDLTLGGGMVLDPFPLHHKRRTSQVVGAMQRLYAGGVKELIAVELHKRRSALSAEETAIALNISPREVQEALSFPREDIATYAYENRFLLIHQETKSRWTDQVLESLENHHKRHPLDSKGRKIEELIGVIGADKGSSSDTVLRLVLEELASLSRVSKVGLTWALYGHEVVLTSQVVENIQFVEDFLKGSQMAIPSMAVLHEEAAKRGMDAESVGETLRYLVDQGRAYFVDGEVLYGPLVDGCRIQLLDALMANEEGITVAEFRDLVKGNRKICLMMLGIFDLEAITTRVGDRRQITSKGKSRLQEK